MGGPTPLSEKYEGRTGRAGPRVPPRKREADGELHVGETNNSQKKIRMSELSSEFGSSKKGRNLIITLNNPHEKNFLRDLRDNRSRTPFNEEFIRSDLDCHYNWIGQPERGQEGTLHCGFFIQLKGQMRFQAIKDSGQILSNSHIEMAKGKTGDCIAYNSKPSHCAEKGLQVADYCTQCVKPGGCIGPNDLIYTDHATPWFDLEPKPIWKLNDFGQPCPWRGKKKDLITTVFDPSASLIDIVEANPTQFIRNSRGIMAAHSIYKEAHSIVLPRTHVIFYSDAKGTGKTLTCTQLSEKWATEYGIKIYEVPQPSISGTWAKYENQEVTVWNEWSGKRYPKFKMASFLDVQDSSFAFEDKGGALYKAVCRVSLFNTNKHPELWYIRAGDNSEIQRRHKDFGWLFEVIPERSNHPVSGDPTKCRWIQDGVYTSRDGKPRKRYLCDARIKYIGQPRWLTEGIRIRTNEEFGWREFARTFTYPRLVQWVENVCYGPEHKPPELEDFEFTTRSPEEIEAINRFYANDGEDSEDEDEAEDEDDDMEELFG